MKWALAAVLLGLVIWWGTTWVDSHHSRESETVRQYLEAVAQGDQATAEAYVLPASRGSIQPGMVPVPGEKIDESRLRVLDLQRNPEATLSTLRGVHVITYSDGQTVERSVSAVLVLQDGQWRVEALRLGNALTGGQAR